MTAAATYHVLHFFNFTVDIRNVCVFTAPWFAGASLRFGTLMLNSYRSGNTAMITFLFAKEIDDNTATGMTSLSLLRP